jgi:hypothetical protein
MARKKENGIAGWMGIQTVSWAIGFWSCDSAALAWGKNHTDRLRRARSQPDFGSGWAKQPWLGSPIKTRIALKTAALSAAAELQAKTENDVWSAPMYSALVESMTPGQDGIRPLSSEPRDALYH